MDFTDYNLYLVILLTITLGLGLTLCFVGALVTVVTAFGNQHKAWAFVCIALLPVTAVYCVLHPKSTRYPQKYIITGVCLICATAGVALGLA